jgi:hypothetical protein
MLSGKSKYPLRDDISLYFVGATGQPVTRCPKNMLAPSELAPLACIGDQCGSKQVRSRISKAHKVVRCQKFA